MVTTETKRTYRTVSYGTIILDNLWRTVYDVLISMPYSTEKFSFQCSTYHGIAERAKQWRQIDRGLLIVRFSFQYRTYHNFFDSIRTARRSSRFNAVRTPKQQKWRQRECGLLLVCTYHIQSFPETVKMAPKRPRRLAIHMPCGRITNYLEEAEEAGQLLSTNKYSATGGVCRE